MDTETKQNTNHSPAAGRTDSPSGSGAHTAEAPKMGELLRQSSVPSGVCDWLSCLRKPGMTLSYSVEKRHVADMDAPRAEPRGGQMSCSDKGNTNQSGNPGKSGGTRATGAADTMACSGTCAVRYFDLAVGGALILAFCGVLKCCLGCCRCVKKKMF